jgi:putative thiamine transport system ATP-binding protein
MKSLRLDGVTIDLGTTRLIASLDVTVGPGEVVTVMGPSGSGKSTLLAFIGGFLDPAFTAAGRVFAGGAEITHLAPEQRRVGILFQDDLLFPHLSVGGNLAFGLRRDGKAFFGEADAGSPSKDAAQKEKSRFHANGNGLSRAERRRIIDQALAAADLAGFADRDPATLSGGQRARVALLRTLLSDPRALLLDEPFGKLDRPLRQDIRRFVFDHAREKGLPVLLVTHDEEDAADAGGPVMRLAGAPLTTH